MKNTKSKEFEDIQSGNNRENYKSFVLPSSDAEFVECQGEVGLEEPGSDVGSDVRSGKNLEETNEKYGDWRSGDTEEGDVRASREDVLYNPIQTALSQAEFQSSQGSGRPTHLTVRPSRFRNEAFETQFQPERKKKIRRMCFHPGRGDFRRFSAVDNVCSFDGKQQKKQQRYSPSSGLVKEDVSNVYGECKLRQRQPGLRTLSRHPLRFRAVSRETEVTCKLNHQYRIRFEDSNIRVPGFRPHVYRTRLIWPSCRFRFGKSEAQAVIGSGAVSDSTRSLQAARDEVNLGNLMPRIQSPCLLRSITSGENEERRSEDGEKSKKEVTELCLHRKNNGKQAIAAAKHWELSWHPTT